MIGGPEVFSEGPPREILSAFRYCRVTGLFLSLSPRNYGKVVGHVPAKGYVKISYRRKMYYAHRLAWMFVHGEWPKHAIDHANGVTTDNRWSNLRKATTAQNNRNRAPVPGRLKGAFYNKRNKRFFSQIMADKKRQFLGCFDTAEQAHAAYAEAAKRLHRDFARTA